MNAKTLILGLVAAAATFVVVATTAAAITVDSDIRTDTTWTLADSPVHVIAPINVANDSLLTIEAGVLVRFETGSSLSVGSYDTWGDNRDKGAIQSLGTELSPVTFTSTSGVRTWGGIDIDGRRGEPSHAIIFRYTTVEKSTDAGLLARDLPAFESTNSTFADNAGPGLQLIGARATVTGSTFRDNAGTALLSDSVVTLTDSTIESNDGVPFEGHPASTMTGVTFRQNGDPAIQFTGGTIGTSRTWDVVTDTFSGDLMHYRLRGDVTVRNEAVLTVDPGVTVELGPGVDLRIGTCCGGKFDRASLIADGTPAERITFTSVSGNREWSGIEIDGSAHALKLPSSVTFATIEKSLGRGLTVRSHSAATVTDSSFIDNGGTGLELLGTSGSFERLASTDNGGQGYYIRDAHPTLRDSVADRNGQMGFYLSNSQAWLRDVSATDNRFGIFSDSNANPRLDGAIVEASREQAVRLNAPGPWDGLRLRDNAGDQIQTYGWTVNNDVTFGVRTDEVTGTQYDYYFLQGFNARNSATVTVEAGVTMIVDYWDGFYVGTCCSSAYAARLIADGTPAEPITFRSPDGGQNWYGVRVDSRTISGDSIVDNVVIQNSYGDGLQYYGARSGGVTETTITGARNDGLYMYDTSVTVSDVTITDAGRWGIRLGGSSEPHYQDVTVTNSASSGFYADSPSAATFDNLVLDGTGTFPLRTAIGSDVTGVVFRDVGQNLLEFYGRDMTTDMTMRLLTTDDTGDEFEARVRTPDPRVFGGATFTFEPGLTVRLGSSVDFIVGVCCNYNANDLGGLDARGTEAEPILFTGVSRLDRWNGFDIEARSLHGELPIVLENVTLERAAGYGIFMDQLNDFTMRNSIVQFNGGGIHFSGSNGEVLDSEIRYNAGTGIALSRVRSSWYGEDTYSHPTLVRNVFKENGGSGLWGEVGSKPDVRDNTFAHNDGAGIRIDIDALNDDNAIAFNGGGVVEIAGGSLTHDLTLDRVIDFETGSTLPYTFVGDASVIRESTLTVLPGVTMRFANDVGLTVGICCSPTNRGSLVAIGDDGREIRFIGTSSARNWDGITFDGSGLDALPSTVRFAEFERNEGAALNVVANDRVTIDHIKIQQAHHGIRVASARITLADIDMEDLNGVGIELVGAHPTLRNIVIEDVGSFGIQADAGSRPIIQSTVIDRTGGSPFRLTPGSDMSGLIVRSVGSLQAQLNAQTVRADATIPGFLDGSTGQALHYRVLGDIVVTDAATLTFGEGADLRFIHETQCSWWSCTDYYYGLTAGVGNGYRETGAVVTEGSEARPVRFGAINGANGFNGVTINGRPQHPDLASSISFTEFRHSRGHGLNVVDHDNFAMEGATAHTNAASGVRLYRTPATVTGGNFGPNPDHGVLLDQSDAKVTGSTFTANAGGGLYVWNAEPTLNDLTTWNNNFGLALRGSNAFDIGHVTFNEDRWDVAILDTNAMFTFTDVEVPGEPRTAAELTSTTGSGAWNRISFQDLDPHHLRVNMTGGQDGFLNVRLLPTFSAASYDYRVYAANGDLTQSDTLFTDVDTGLEFRVALNSYREARLDVVPEVTVDFTWDPLTPTRVHDVTFTDTTDVRFATITGHTWDFGDGTTSTDAAPVYRYSQLGDFTIRHCVTTNPPPKEQACAEKGISVVNHVPIASVFMDPPNPMFMEEVTFDGASIDPDGFVVKRGWEFGDDTDNNLAPDNVILESKGNVPFGFGNAEVTHRYQHPGHYLLNLTIEDNLGSQAVLQVEVWIRTAAERAVEEIAAALEAAGSEYETIEGSVNEVRDEATGTLGAVGDAAEAAVEGNVTAMRAALRQVIADVDIEPAGMLCLEAALGLSPAVGPAATCANDVMLRNAAELDEIRAEVEHEIERTEVPPPFVPDPIEVINNPPPPPPTPPLPEVPDVDPENPPDPTEEIPEPPNVDPENPPDPTQFIPEPPEVDPEELVPEVPEVPELPEIPSVCLSFGNDEICVP